MLARVGVLALVVLFTGTIATPASTRIALEGHQSSLLVSVTMTDGTCRRITLQGVGCTQGMCSRVHVKDIQTNNVWLDGLLSVSDISQNATGPVHAVFTFKNGESRQASVPALNRVLYVGNLFWIRQLDLAKVRRVDFE
jgi:hypothetical protein